MAEKVWRVQSLCFSLVILCSHLVSTGTLCKACARWMVGHQPFSGLDALHSVNLLQQHCLIGDPNRSDLSITNRWRQSSQLRVDALKVYEPFSLHFDDLVSLKQQGNKEKAQNAQKEV